MLLTETKGTSQNGAAVDEGAVLREYGPEFNVDDGIHLDDHYLPHIDPRLTTTHRPPASPPPTAPTSWEPLITKVYHSYESDDVNRLSIINTDIY